MNSQLEVFFFAFPFFLFSFSFCFFFVSSLSHRYFQDSKSPRDDKKRKKEKTKGKKKKRDSLYDPELRLHDLPGYVCGVFGSVVCVCANVWGMGGVESVKT